MLKRGRTGRSKLQSNSPSHRWRSERTIELCDDEIRLSYELTNLSGKEEACVWAIHTLLIFQAGDELVMPASTRALLNGAPWIDAVASAVPENNCAKVFAAPVSEGVIAINNQNTGDWLEFQWDPKENGVLGLWLTRGGWHGHHHFALEPTNADADALTVAAGRKRCGVVAAFDSVTWQIRLRASSRR